MSLNDVDLLYRLFEARDEAREAFRRRDEERRRRE